MHDVEHCLRMAIVNLGLSNEHYKSAKRSKDNRVRAKKYVVMALDYRRIANNYEMLAQELTRLHFVPAR